MDKVKCSFWMWVCLCSITCSQLNVALKKNASTTSGHYSTWYPSGAVDGDHDTLNSPSSCFHSASAPADWTVDLGQEYQLYNIIVYLRLTMHDRTTFFDRTANSIIYVDNNRSRVCYTFPSTISDNPTHLTCYETARYVTIMNPGNEGYEDTLHICEVEIYACHPGYSGVNCSMDCHCDECDRWTGVCSSSCRAGWEGGRCDQACTGTYGSKCNNSCTARHCNNSSNSCDPVNGTCDSGCLPGWSGPDCMAECPSSTYGLNCNKNCTHRHCLDSYTCDHVTGACDQGCEAGWKSIDCNEECTEGEEFGPNCSGSCNARHCLNPSSCHPVYGFCGKGCEAGWEGLQCQQAEKVPDVNDSSVSTTTDTGMIALSTTVGVLVVIIAILSVLLIRTKLNKQSSNRSCTDIKRSTPDASPSTDDINTGSTSSDTTSYTAPSTYETLQLTEDNHYTGLDGRNFYENA